MTFFKFPGPLPQTSLYLSHSRITPSRITPKWNINTLWPLLSVVLMLLPFTAPAQNSQRPPAVTSDSDLYYGIFHHVAVLKQMADTAQKQGQDRSNLRQFVRLRAGLTEAEGGSLEATPSNARRMSPRRTQRRKPLSTNSMRSILRE